MSQDNFLQKSVKKNKIILLILGFLSFLFGAFFPIISRFDPYAWYFAGFFWFFTGIMFFAWKQQNKILDKGTVNEDIFIKEKIEVVRKKLAGQNQIQFHKYHIIIVILSSIAFEFCLYVMLIPVSVALGKMTNGSFVPILFNNNNTLYLSIILVMTFLIFQQILMSYEFIMNKDSLTQKSIFKSKTIKFNEIKDYQYTFHPLILEHMVIGKLFKLVLNDKNNQTIELNFSYNFQLKPDNTIDTGNIIFWLAEKLANTQKL